MERLEGPFNHLIRIPQFLCKQAGREHTMEAQVIGQEITEYRLAYLYEVAMQGGVRAAAESLGVNPSAVSRQISLLERHIKIPLLEKQGRNVVVTQAGKLLIEHHREMLYRRRQLAETLQDMRHLRRGSVSLRVGQGMINEFVKGPLQQFSADYPDVFVDIYSGNMSETINMMLRGKVDMAISFGPLGDPPVMVRSFHRGPICALFPSDNPLATQESITLEALATQRLIFMSEQFGIQLYINEMFRDQLLAPLPAYQCNHFSTAVALVVSGMGIAFMTRPSAYYLLNRDDVVAVPIDHPLSYAATCHLVRGQGRRLSPAAEHLWKVLLSSMQSKSE